MIEIPRGPVPDTPAGRALKKIADDMLQSKSFKAVVAASRALDERCAELRRRLGRPPLAQGIAAGTDETRNAAQPEGQEPGPKDAPNPPPSPAAGR